MVSTVAPQNPFMLNTRKILVVDTSGADSVKRLEWEFPRDRYQLTIASGTAQAMELVAAGTSYDMALVEVDLPRRSSSMTLLRTLRRQLPATPVIMYTDYGDEELWVDVVNEGASDLISRCDLCRGVEERF